jgi:hypothetical protein
VRCSNSTWLGLPIPWLRDFQRTALIQQLANCRTAGDRHKVTHPAGPFLGMVFGNDRAALSSALNRQATSGAEKAGQFGANAVQRGGQVARWR